MTDEYRTDAELARAERQLRKLRAQAASARGQAADRLSDRIWPLVNKISRTPPVTLFGAAIKLRLLADKDIALLIGNNNADRVSLRQVRDFVEREVAAGHTVFEPGLHDHAG